VNPLRLQALAVGASLTHVLVDFQVGLFGAGAAMTALQAANILDYAAVYALWAWAIGAAGGNRGAVAALVIFAGIWSAFAQGIVGLAACPPPCGGTLGLQDAAHLLSLVFGGWAAFATARVSRESAATLSWWPSIFALAFIVAGFVLQAMTFATMPRLVG
jgi:hypothetical protein